VDLTHWDVSHVSNANKAFVSALKFDYPLPLLNSKYPNCQYLG
jgi:hypothetical protein